MMHAIGSAQPPFLNQHSFDTSDAYPQTLLTHTDSLETYLADILSTLILTSGRHIAIALSGGSDSMALTLLMAQWAKTRQRNITALTVNHGLRENAASEALQTHAIMESLGISHVILTPTLDTTIQNIQQRARTARYNAMTAWCEENNASYLMVAHNFDDQAETIALQNHRGSTPPSQSGMALLSHWNNIALVRPLLGVRKSTLMAWLKSHHHLWIEDPTNASDVYARNRLRRTMDDDTIIANWHHAQKQGALRHAEDIARNEWCNTHCHLYPFGVVACDRSAWLRLNETLRSDMLSRAIMHINGAYQRPRHHESARLTLRVSDTTNGKATLGGTLIRWSESQLIISRELSRLPSAITLFPSQTPKHFLWDNRFTLTYQLLTPAVLGPLGQKGYNILRQLHHDFPTEFANIHSSFLFALPALWHLDTVLCVPHIDYHSPALNASDTFEARYTPSKPLAGEPFWWFNHAPYHTEEL